MDSKKSVAPFIFEMSSLRLLQRAHRQGFLAGDQSDSIAAHSHLVTVIGYLLATDGDCDPIETMEVMVMCTFHDSPEARTGDHNHIHKRYVVVDEELARKEQYNQLPEHISKDIGGMMAEYEERTSTASLLAKDADLLAQIVLIKEYAHAGNNEARQWFSAESQERKRSRLQTDSGKRFFDELRNLIPTSWWHGLTTPVNRRLPQG